MVRGVSKITFEQLFGWFQGIGETDGRDDTFGKLLHHFNSFTSGQQPLMHWLVDLDCFFVVSYRCLPVVCFAVAGTTHSVLRRRVVLRKRNSFAWNAYKGRLGMVAQYCKMRKRFKHNPNVSHRCREIVQN